MTKTHVPQFLETLPLTKEAQFWSIQPEIRQISLYTPQSNQNELFFHFLECFQNEQHDQKLENQFNSLFSQIPNQLYEKMQIFPKKLYVCGNCKDYYTDGIQYLTHCLLLNCPINHNRSTIFLNFKNSSRALNNNDFGTILKRWKQVLIKQINLNDIHYHIGQYQLQKIQEKEKKYNCGKCSFQGNIQHYFIKHCVYQCKSSRCQKTSPLISKKQTKQSISDFKKDVQNLVLNYNILTLFKDSYIRIILKQQFSQNYLNEKNLFKCPQCRRILKTSNQYLEHLLFNCQIKSLKKSSHLLEKRTFQLQKKCDIQSNKKTQENQIKKRKVQEIPEVKLSPYTYEKNYRYRNQLKILDKYFWCNYCQKSFQNPNIFIAHCLTLLCPINDKYNSYYFFNSNGQELRKEEAKQIIQLEQYYEFFETFTRSEIEKRYNLIDNQTNMIQNQQFDELKCGKCRKRYKSKDTYVNHILFKCYGSENNNNSHSIRLRQNNINSLSEEQNKILFQNNLYAKEIMKSKPNSIFYIQKNPEMNTENNNFFVCGKCKSSFKSRYNFLHHCLNVCSNLNDKSHSHLIFEKISLRDFENPLNIIQLISYTEDIREQRVGKRRNADQNSKKDLIEGLAEAPVQVPEQMNIVPRLYPNLSYHNHQISSNYLFNQEYFCGVCELPFKRKQSFFSHLSSCKNFQNQKSSHFLMIASRRLQYMDSFIMRIRRGTELQTQIEISSRNKYTCGCGLTLSSEAYSTHLFTAHSYLLPKGSSHIIVQIKIKGLSNLVLMKVDENDIYPGQIYYCPCRPFRQMKRTQFVNHVLKVHKGRSPLCYLSKQT